MKHNKQRKVKTLIKMVGLPNTIIFTFVGVFVNMDFGILMCSCFRQ